MATKTIFRISDLVKEASQAKDNDEDKGREWEYVENERQCDDEGQRVLQKVVQGSVCTIVTANGAIVVEDNS